MLALRNSVQRALLHIYRFEPRLTSRTVRPVRWILRYLAFHTLIQQRQFINRWSSLEILLLFTYLGANITCLCVPFPSLSEACLRAGRLAVINTATLYAAPNLSLAADIFSVSLATFRRLHSSVGHISLVLVVVHAIFSTVTHGMLSIKLHSNRFALVVRKSPLVISSTLTVSANRQL